MFKQILASYDIEVSLDLRVFFSEAVDFFLGEAAAETGVEFAGELVLRISI